MAFEGIQVATGRQVEQIYRPGEVLYFLCTF